MLVSRNRVSFDMLATLQNPAGESILNKGVSTLVALLLSFNASAQDRSSDYTRDYQQKALEVYRHSISLRTAAGHGLVPVMAEYLAGQFIEAGFPADDVHLIPFMVGHDEAISGLVVRYRGDGSAGKKPIALMAHMDVVDALPQDWERDPFTLIEEEGYFFGRGSLDDKFGTTMLTTTFLRLKKEGFVPTRDLVIIFTGDEETGMVSTRELVTTHRDLTDAEYILNADAGGGVLGAEGFPTAYNMQAAEKTFATFELTIRNPGGHSSMPRADNAIYELAHALRNIEQYRFPVRTNDVTLQYLAQTAEVTDGASGGAMRRIYHNPQDEEAADILFDDPFLVGITRTTCIPTMLQGGHAENALPQSATATVNCRIFPGIEIEEVQQTLNRVAATEALEIKVLGDPMASPASELREDVSYAIAKAVHATYPDIPIVPYMSAYGTDGKETRAAGIPTYGVMGLFIKPVDEFSHGLNERVPVRSFYAALEHWYIIINELAGN